MTVAAGKPVMLIVPSGRPHHAARSLTGEATAILDRLVDLRRRHYVPAICLARVCSRLGNTATAIEWLEATFAERNGEVVFLEQPGYEERNDDIVR